MPLDAGLKQSCRHVRFSAPSHGCISERRGPAAFVDGFARLWVHPFYATVLGQEFASGRLAGKTIVLTGAMIPYKFGSSDGLFNLGSALAFAQTLPPGV